MGGKYTSTSSKFSELPAICKNTIWLYIQKYIYYYTFLLKVLLKFRFEFELLQQK